MKKILVTSDFSSHSKAGIRFALQLASQTDCELIFLHVIEVLKPTSWSTSYYKKFEAAKISENTENLMKLVASLQKGSIQTRQRHQFIALTGTNVGKLITGYAKKIKADAICMSTHGAGNIQKIFGTNASHMVTTSPLPVFVIPKGYKVKPVINIMYASDFADLGNELKKLLPFARSLKAKTGVIHYDYLLHVEENRKKLQKKAEKHMTQDLAFHFKKQQIEKPLSSHLRADISRLKPSLVVLFTKQNRDWFDRLFLSSEAADLAFNSSTPLLTFRKKV